MQKAQFKSLQQMSKRDQQLYCTWEDVESVWVYLKQSNVLANLCADDWLIEDCEPALEELFSLDELSDIDSMGIHQSYIVHPDKLNQWALTYLTRDAWRKIKKSYARFKYNQKNQIFKIDVKDETRRALLAMKDQLGSASYDEVLQHQQRQLEALQAKLQQAQSEQQPPIEQSTNNSIQQYQVPLSDKQHLQQQAMYLTDEVLAQHLIERLPSDYRAALQVVIKNLFCEGYLQAKADKQRSVRKMQEHLETNDYLKQLGPFDT